MQALEGLKVADFTWAVVGPMMARYLANHGATVARIESAHRPDVVRLAPPFKDGKTDINRSGYYTPFNTGKLGIALNLSHPRGPEVARKIVAWADVVMESFAPGVMARWGLDYDYVKKSHPQVVYISTTNLGQTGPQASRTGFGTQLVSLAGFTHLTGWPDREPNHPYGAYTDVIAPRFGMCALLAALDYRRRTGQGQYLDLSQLEASLHFLSPLLLDYFAQGHEATRQGNRSPTACPHGAYPCKEEDGRDRWCAIAVETEEQWQALGRALGNPSWTRDARFAILQGRLQHQEELDRLLGEWTRHHTAGEVMARLQEAGVPAGVVQDSRDLLGDPQLRHRETYQVLDHPEIGPHHHPYPPFHLSATPAQLRPAPLLGQHTEFFLRQVLGMPEEEYVQLLLDGVLE